MALLGLRRSGLANTLALLKRGLPATALERLAAEMQISQELLARVAAIPPRTLARRRAQGRLSRLESERLFRLARVFDQSVALFEGDADAAREWLQSPCRGLGDETPLSILESEVGARAVEDLIGRLEHGVFT
jgi:putative toxin-antitoxin system antitoxin component (TIGR02293 family)